jgi:hypothetical protein
MVEKFEDWGDYELGMIAKAFMDCGNCKSCAECPCDGVLCCVGDIKKAREDFVSEFARRVMA